jgi:hypothetical protein
VNDREKLLYLRGFCSGLQTMGQFHLGFFPGREESLTKVIDVAVKELAETLFEEGFMTDEFLRAMEQLSRELQELLGASDTAARPLHERN